MDMPTHPVSGSDDESLKDPVCGMTVTRTSPHQAEHAGRPYWFCSAGCHTKFLAKPQKYLVPVTAPTEDRGSSRTETVRYVPPSATFAAPSLSAYKLLLPAGRF